VEVERAIDPRPEARYATLDTFCSGLQETSSALRSWGRPMRRTLRRAAALLVVLAIAAVALVVIRSPLDPAVVAVRFQHHGGSTEAREVVDGRAQLAV
jgi:hypothetical protein